MWSAREGGGVVCQRWRERERGVGGPRGKGGWVVDRERRVNLSREGREKRTGPKGSKPRKIQRGSADSIGGKRTRGPSDRIEAARAPRYSQCAAVPRRVARDPSTPPPPRMFSLRATITITTTTTTTTKCSCYCRWDNRPRSRVVDRLSRVFLSAREGERDIILASCRGSIDRGVTLDHARSIPRVSSRCRSIGRPRAPRRRERKVFALVECSPTLFRFRPRYEI